MDYTRAVSSTIGATPMAATGTVALLIHYIRDDVFPGRIFSIDFFVGADVDEQ
jgi:hypothetical protein